MVWNKIRLGFLSLLSVGLVLAVGQVGTRLLNSEPDAPVASDSQDSPLSAFEIEFEPTIEGWEFVSRREIEIPARTGTFGAIYEGQAFRYEGDRDSELLVEMYHLVALDPEVRDILWGLQVVPDYTIRSSRGNGHYGLLEYRGRAYLSSCINPSGSSTFTSPQFRRNRYLFDLSNPQRLYRWLKGEQPLQDHRCLLANLSVSLEDLELEAAFAALEAAWQDWYPSWNRHFQEFQPVAADSVLHVATALDAYKEPRF